MVDERIAKYPVSGEINPTLSDPKALATVRERYEAVALGIDEIDGVSMEFLRLAPMCGCRTRSRSSGWNVETRGDSALPKGEDRRVLRTLEQTDEDSAGSDQLPRSAT